MSDPTVIEPSADDEPVTFEFFGETLRFNPSSDYQWEMLEFAEAATNGADSELLAGMAATMSLLKAAIQSEDWERFRSLARKNKASTKDDLMPIVVGAFTQKTRRPTVRPSDSSAGPPITLVSSEEGSSSRVVRRLEERGRPDLGVMVLMAEEARSRASVA